MDAGIFVVPGDGVLSDAGVAMIDAGEVPPVVVVEVRATPAPVPGVIDVTVKGDTVARRIEQSSASVTVVDLTTNRKQSSDLGEVLARTQGVSVRRSGGLGSGDRLSINGLDGERVRVYVDGLPIAASPYGTGLANIPVNLVERVEIYRGVVPIKFGADALGGAINVVTKAPTRGLGGSASLMLGSFGTTRATADGHHYDPRSGLLTRATAYADHAKNDYPVEVLVANATGGDSKQKVYRQHDGYTTFGGGIDVGMLRRKWAEKLILKTYASGYSKDVQSNLVMTNPYGEVNYSGQSYGANLEYAQPLTETLKLDALWGYGYSHVNFDDTGKSIYDWYGNKLRPIASGGELDPQGIPYDIVTRNHGVFGRVSLKWEIANGHSLNLTAAPSLAFRETANDGIPATSFDQMAGNRRRSVMISALEYASTFLDERLDNSLFGKSYFFKSTADERIERGGVANRDQRLHRFGVGDGVRYHFTQWLYAKASYELATRIPTVDELFGDGRRITANLLLRPERSHNTNLQLALHDLESKAGTFMLQASFFDRRARDLIAPPFIGGASSTGAFAIYKNVGAAKATGFELVGSWVSPGNYLGFNGNVTWQNYRNEATTGESAKFKGDRIPHVPYFFYNLTARGTLSDAIVDRDELSLFYYARYVHQFYRGWESAGQGIYANYKQQVDSQLSHTLSLTYTLRSAGKSTYSMSLDAQNITDQPLFDEFGAQRPGRGYYMKLTAER